MGYDGKKDKHSSKKAKRKRCMEFCLEQMARRKVNICSIELIWEPPCRLSWWMKCFNLYENVLISIHLTLLNLVWDY